MSATANESGRIPPPPGPEISWQLAAVGIHRLPQAFRWDGLLEGVDRGHGAPWRTAIAALETDPDAELPG
jgi:hypothetical protein